MNIVWLSWVLYSSNGNMSYYLISQNDKAMIYSTRVVHAFWNVTTLTLSQCTLAGPVYTGMPLECHWLTQCTLEHHWKNWKQPHTGMPLEKLSWIRPTLGCHWRNSNFYSIHRNTTGGTVTAHTRPVAYSLACRVASMPVWNDKMAGHQ